MFELRPHDAMASCPNNPMEHALSANGGLHGRTNHDPLTHLQRLQAFFSPLQIAFFLLDFRVEFGLVGF